MRGELTLVITAGLLAMGGAAAAQATGTTTFNAPYRAFQRSEFGALLSFPNGGGTALEGAYRYASGTFDIGFKGGFLDPSGGGNTVLLLGAEGRERVITHTVDFPLDGALVVGVGGNFVSGNSALLFPVGLSLGRRIDPQGSTVSIVPYAQPTLFVVAGNNVTDHVRFALGLGADFRLSRAFDARLSAGLGDVEGVSLGAVWVH
jgi:hypothetical protein